MYHMKIYILYKSSFLIFSFSFPFHIVLECGAIFGHKYCFLTYVISTLLLIVIQGVPKKMVH